MMLMHRPVPLIFVGNIMEDGWYGLATRVLFEYLSLSYSITRISAYHDYFRISWIILKLCQGIMATVNLTGLFVARRWSDKTGLCRLHVRTSCLAHGCGLVSRHRGWIAKHLNLEKQRGITLPTMLTHAFANDVFYSWSTDIHDL